MLLLRRVVLHLLLISVLSHSKQHKEHSDWRQNANLDSGNNGITVISDYGISTATLLNVS
jgi:hypothetical protein